jgi:hypothetical protein
MLQKCRHFAGRHPFFDSSFKSIESDFGYTHKQSLPRNSHIFHSLRPNRRLMVYVGWRTNGGDAGLGVASEIPFKHITPLPTLGVLIISAIAHSTVVDELSLPAVNMSCKNLKI